MRNYLLFSAIWLISSAYGQQPAFQYVINSSGSPEGMVVLKTQEINGRTVTGHPVSATEERHSLQLLGDGTRIETTDTDRFYRDDQGRTRIERQNGTVLIEDPVQGLSAEINGEHKIVRRSLNQAVKRMKAELDADIRKLAAEAGAQKTGAASTASTAPNAAFAGSTVEAKLQAEANAKKAQRGTEEDLGYQSVGGVTAKGARNTTTIAAGQIGNDREIKIVNERWYSSDLQMNVKTVNSDPRFGETTYQLTNILQGAPDPSLFLIPPSHVGDSVQE